MIRVLIAALAPAVRAGLRALLAADDGLEVVAETPLVEEPRQLPAGIEVLVVAEGAAGPALERLVRAREGQLALLLLADAPEAARGIYELPLRGWGLLPLDVTGEELVAAIHAVHQGLLVGARLLFEPLLARPGLLSDESLQPLDEPLTSRESEVLQLLAQGLANKQIALALHISEHTVKFHVSSIYAKLGATNRTEAVSVGARRGLVAL